MISFRKTFELTERMGFPRDYLVSPDNPYRIGKATYQNIAVQGVELPAGRLDGVCGG